jgi:hypothetical protein
MVLIITNCWIKIRPAATVSRFNPGLLVNLIIFLVKIPVVYANICNDLFKDRAK